MAQRTLEARLHVSSSRDARRRHGLSAASRWPAASRRTSRSTGASGCCRRSRTSTCFPTWATAASRVGAAVAGRAPRSAIRSRRSLDRHRPRSRVRPRRHRARAARSRGLRCRSCPDIAAARRRAAGRGTHRAVVSGPHGVRAARARAAQRAGAARSSGAARSAQSRAEAARLVPAVLPQPARERGAARARRLDRQPESAHDDGLHGGAGLSRGDGRRDQRRRLVPPADGRRRRTGSVRRAAARACASGSASARC